jgi:CRP-like cAMP-binding protein
VAVHTPLARTPAAAYQDNRLLSLLSDEALAAVVPHLELVPLEVSRLLETEGRPIKHAYFPVEGVVSVLASAIGAEAKIEVGTMGREGIVGLPLLFGATHATGDSFTQIEGRAFRMPAGAFLEAARTLPDMVGVLHRFSQAYLVQVSQCAACNRVHSVSQRCARWLLMTHDRVSSDSFALKQEFLGIMLGERRVSVSRAEANLRDLGIIAYSRGMVKVLDRVRLEAAACPCYQVIRAVYDKMLRS